MQDPQWPFEDPTRAFYAQCGVTVHLRELPQNRFDEGRAQPPPPPRAAVPAEQAMQRPPAAPAPAPPTPRRTSERASEHTSEHTDERTSERTDERTSERTDERTGDPTGAERHDAPVGDAREAAAQATTLSALHAAVRAFDGCPLKATARQACVGEGPLGAPLMFVGEAPGRDEDAEGRPFVGRSGQLLERMIAAIGFERHDVYISNVIPWRPPANRTPTPLETATCEVFIRREIAIVAPKIVVPLGGPSAKLLLRTSEGIVRQRGRWTRYEDDDVSLDALPTFHPAYLLRTPAEKRRSWQDLLALKERLEEVHGLPSTR